MKIPLLNRLKSSSHKKIALLQDEVIDVVYSILPEAVLHGGTAIWRCYSGSRFSEDLDFYVSDTAEFKEKFLTEMNSRGLQILKFKKTENTIFSKISDGFAEVRFEAAFRQKESIVGNYEKADGISMNVLVLSAEDLLLEKIAAYSGRKLVRDFYDIYFLSSQELNDETRKKLKEFIGVAEKPLDEKNLKTILYSGAIPSFEQMLEALKRRCLK